jgi:hypothetical protein
LLKGYEKVNLNTPIELIPSLNQAGPAGNLRGQKLRIEQELVKNCEQIKHFLFNRVQEAWNNLPHDFVQAPSIYSFKAKLDKRHQETKTNEEIKYIRKN